MPPDKLKKIVYIGNNLKTSNPTTLDLLSNILKGSSYQVSIYSNKNIKLVRLFHMSFGVLKNIKADCILIDTYSTTNFYYALVISQLARLLSIPYIPILHGGNLPNRLENNPKLCELLFSNAFKNVAPSNYLVDAFQEKGFDTILIPNAIQIEQYPFKERNKLQPKLLWLRAFDRIYNPKMAIKVLSELKKTYPIATLCMIGPDKDGSLAEVKQLAEDLKVIDAIEFTGFLTKEQWIQKSALYDIFINTTNIDNMPVSVIEAMALGLPVISTNIGGIPYLIREGKDGLLVLKKNSMHMVEKITELLENSARVVEITNNARRLAESFDIEIIQQQWERLLK